ncbi:MAG TPA: RluA family pseudouridine synthase [Chitinivibrionales bacterium]|nr:RluA family pseudouridine synthase [Chitinivibrionales bacterium]
MKLTSYITQKYASSSLIEYLSHRFTYLDREEWRERIAGNQVSVNDAPALPDVKLGTGDIVSYDFPDLPEPAADTNYSVIYEDEWLFAVNKPGNLLVHKAGRNITKNLVFLLRHASNNPVYASAHAVSRLDRETSGIVLFAKDLQCLKKLHKEFAAKTVAKEYLAVVRNVPKEKEMKVDLAIGQDTASGVTYKFRVDAKNGKEAVTFVETLCAGESYSLVRAIPVTGRTHQVRIHLAAIGCPVMGDKLYGMKESDYLAWRSDPEGHALLLEFPRQALHCRSLKFVHPVTNNEMFLKAAIPEDMLGLIEKYKFPTGQNDIIAC